MKDQVSTKETKGRDISVLFRVLLVVFQKNEEGTVTVFDSPEEADGNRDVFFEEVLKRILVGSERDPEEEIFRNYPF